MKCSFVHNDADLSFLIFLLRLHAVFCRVCTMPWVVYEVEPAKQRSANNAIPITPGRQVPGERIYKQYSDVLSREAALYTHEVLAERKQSCCVRRLLPIMVGRIHQLMSTHGRQRNLEEFKTGLKTGVWDRSIVFVTWREQRQFGDAAYVYACRLVHKCLSL